MNKENWRTMFREIDLDDKVMMRWHISLQMRKLFAT